MTLQRSILWFECLAFSRKFNLKRVENIEKFNGFVNFEKHLLWYFIVVRQLFIVNNFDDGNS